MKIAITGTIGSGKSTVSDIFRKHGFEVYDADAVTRKLSEKDGAGYRQIVDAFDNVTDEDGKLNRKKLAEIIFNNIQQKEKLENILYPLLVKDMLQKMDEQELFIAEVPVLFEAGFEEYFDKVILVVADQQVIYQRLYERGMNEKQINERIRNQFSVNKKMDLSDHIIENNADMATLEKKVTEYILTYLNKGEVLNEDSGKS